MLTYVKRVGPGEKLRNRKIAIIIANEFEDIELLYPFLRLSEEGAEVVIIPIMFGSHPRPACKDKPITGRYGIPVPLGFHKEGIRYAIREINQVKPIDFDAIIIPGGFSPDRLRIIKEVIDFIKEAYKKDKIIAAICHGPQLLISAGIIKGKKCTSYEAVKDDLINAGAKFVDEPAVKDGNVITARVPDDLPEFCQLIIESLA
jgi:protease I